ncbi:MAG: raffinose/stachyose/melibiose transport system substrate-binding protein [Devosia sp.]|jgi:raffinose/stachyose/melibiose transport system substrate-binding protein
MMKLTHTLVALSALLAASPTLAQEITVWDWKSGDPVAAAYFDQAKSAFEAAHPGATINYVFQPNDQYYTLLGTALSSGAGPDVFLMNGGAQAKARIEALVDLTAEGADLIGTEEFAGDDGKLYALPLTLQGFVVYYNKGRYTEASLDAENPPTTWAELEAACEAIKAKGAVPCFALGNKEGYGAEFFLSSVAATSLTAQEQADWTAGKLKWSSPQIKAILQAWVDTQANGWYPQGANSTAKFMDEYEMFMRGEAASTIGLLSDVAHWKQFDEFLGADNLGVFRHPSPTIAADKTEGEPKVPVSGGIGYGVNKASANVDLAKAFVAELASPGPIQTFVNIAGVVPANTKVDTSGLASPSIKTILEWLGTSSAPTAHANASAQELEEWHRQSQLLLNGETSVDDAAARLDTVQAEAKPQG